MTYRKNSRVIPQYIKKAVFKTFSRDANVTACYGTFTNGRRWAAKREGTFDAVIVANHPLGGIYESWIVL